jgi:RNA polymerase sigma-70 factor, ECF subfamily
MAGVNERRSNPSPCASDPSWTGAVSCDRLGVSQGGPRLNVIGERLSQDLDDASDEDLMSRFCRGNREAFVLLVKRHQTPLYNFALRHLASSTAAEDVVQESFIRVFQNAPDFRTSSRFTAWLYAIARNLCIDFLRKRTHRRHQSLDELSGTNDGRGHSTVSLGDRTADDTANVERTAMALEIGARVLSAINQLPEDQREVFLLREISNLPFNEIAKVVQAPENTVKSRMRYALERLQAALSEFEEYGRALR